MSRLEFISDLVSCSIIFLGFFVLYTWLMHPIDETFTCLTDTECEAIQEY